MTNLIASEPLTWLQTVWAALPSQPSDDLATAMAYVAEGLGIPASDYRLRDVDATPSTVWLLEVEHKFGRNLSVYICEADARADLANFARTHWATENIPGTIPDDHDEAIARYFAVTEDQRGQEAWGIQEVRLGSW